MPSVSRSTIAQSFAALLFATPSLASERISIVQANPAQDGKDVGETRILVDGPSANGAYDEVQTKTLDVWARVSLEKLPGAKRIEAVELRAEGVPLKGEVHYGSRRYRFTLPYADPRSPNVANQRNSPIAICNARLATMSGAARKAFLRTGMEVRTASAYLLSAKAFGQDYAWSDKVDRYVPVPETIDSAKGTADAVIVCRPLDRPRVRKDTVTRGVEPDPGRRMEPAVRSVSLRIEPALAKPVSGQLCPTQLKLYGRVETARALRGKAVFFGTGYLSPVTPIDLADAGSRTVIATYPLNWATRGA